MNGQDASFPSDGQGAVMNVAGHVNDIRSLLRGE
jgi:hypothetical protein